MNAPRTILLALLASAFASAQDPLATPSAAAPAQTEMQKWIATTDAQWQATYKREVNDVHEAEAKKLMLQYLTSIDAAITKASGAGDLDGSVALRNEQKRFGDTNVFLEQDDPADHASVKQLRAAVRAQKAKLEKDSASRTKTLHAKYDQLLAQAQAQLTQRQRFDEALLVKAKRDEVAAAWLASLPAAAPIEVPEKPVAPIATPNSPAAPAAAGTGTNLFTNGNFEQGTDGWTLNAHRKKGEMAVDAKELHKGKPSLRVENVEADDTQVTQKVSVKPNTRYRLAGYIKTKDVETEKRGGKDGATLAVTGGFAKTPPVFKTKTWTRVDMTYVTGAKQTEIAVGPRLGHHGAVVLGTAWFAELTLTELGRNAKQ